ncbi:MAG TPA: hypothetical protein VM910_31785 [Bradyrhizobium sp.]|nr:hypothetical protein [Bradyrhizobium sp.]
MGINRARQNKKTVAAVAFARRRRSRSDSLHQPVADENITTVNNSIGKDDRTDEDLICHTLSFDALVPRNIGAAESLRTNALQLPAGTLDEPTPQIEPRWSEIADRKNQMEQ